MKGSLDITASDFFCGAGGSTTGMISIPGVRVSAASNHWDKAIETHQYNHQHTEHILADLSQITPKLFPRTTIGWFSPECTWHSNARGAKRLAAQISLLSDDLPSEAAERSRATMWDVVRFTDTNWSSSRTSSRSTHGLSTDHGSRRCMPSVTNIASFV